MSEVLTLGLPDEAGEVVLIGPEGRAQRRQALFRVKLVSSAATDH